MVTHQLGYIMYDFAGEGSVITLVITSHNNPPMPQEPARLRNPASRDRGLANNRSHLFTARGGANEGDVEKKKKENDTPPHVARLPAATLSSN